MRFQIRQSIDLARENVPLYYAQPLANGNQGAHVWRVSVWENGRAVDLNGCAAVAYVRQDVTLEDGTTPTPVMVKGTVADNVASVVLPPDVYALGGALIGAMDIADTAGATATTAILYAKGETFMGEDATDPGGSVPDVAQLLAYVDAMKTETAKASEAAESAESAAESARAAAALANAAAETARMSVPPSVFLDGEIPTTKDDVLATMTVKSDWLNFFAYIRIKCQGTSSMTFDKKNFTIKLYRDEAREIPLEILIPGWGMASSKFVLKANYVDHTHARNIIGARMWTEVVRSRPDYESLPQELRSSPCCGAVDGFPIKVYANGNYQGMYTWNIGKDAWMFGIDEEDPNHVVLSAQTNTNGAYAETPCNFRALWSGIDEEHWEVEVGENSEAVKTSLNNLIGFVMDASDEEFRAGLDEYLDVQSAVDYYLFMYANGGFDNLAKNMLLITYDLKKWYCSAYDMDVLWGCNGLANMFLGATKPCPEEYAEPYSLLWERVETAFYAELRARYESLRTQILTFANTLGKVERFCDAIGKERYAEDVVIYPDIPLADEDHIKQIREFVRDRLPYVDGEIMVIGSGMPGGAAYALAQDTLFDGVGDYIDTGVALFDTEKDWTIFFSFTSAEWVNNATVMSAQTPGWATGLSLYAYVSATLSSWTIGGGGNDIGGTEGLNGFAYNPDIGAAPWLNMTEADPTTMRYNVVFRWDSQTKMFYYATSKNGVSGNYGAYTVPYRQHFRPVIFGCEHESSAGGQHRFFHGTIHKAGVWLKCLTDQQASQLLTL